MKKVFMGMFAIATMLLATSCSEDELIAQSSGNEVTVSFTASVRSDVKTKAVGDDTDGIDQLIFAVYDEKGDHLSALDQEITTFTDVTENGVTKKTATINVVLVKGQTYSFAFWAQNKDYEVYSFNPGTAEVSIDYKKQENTANNREADAFFANETLTVSGSFEKDITLKRPFAQVNFLTTIEDIKNARAAGFDPKTSSIVIENAATSLNVLTGEVDGNEKAVFNYANLLYKKDKPNEIEAISSITGLTGVYKYLATAYFLPTEATAETQITTSMEVKAEESTKGVVALTAPDVKARRNYRTNIYGNLLTSNGQFNVTIDPIFEGNYSVEVEEETVNGISELQDALNNTDNKAKTEALTYNVEDPNITEDITITIPDDTQASSLTFDLSKSTIADGKDVSIIGTSYDNPIVLIMPKDADLDDLTINAPGAHVTVKQGTFDNVTATTSNTTLEVGAGTTIGSLTVKQGNVRIAEEGKVGTIVNETGGTLYIIDAGGTLPTTLPKNTIVIYEDTKHAFALNDMYSTDKIEDLISYAKDVFKENNITISLTKDVTGDVTIGQEPDVKITLLGNERKFNGVITVDGKSATYITAGLTIKDVVFDAQTISKDACIRLGDGTNNTRYTCNVTVDNCTFDVSGAVGVKSYTGGDKNLTITGCTATANAHSLAQLAGVDEVLIEGCTINSVRGMNFNSSTNVAVDNCSIDVKKYAARFGAGSSASGVGTGKVYSIKNSTLKSANEEGDAVIVLRGTADNSTLTIENTTIEGNPQITNTATNATVIIDGVATVSSANSLLAVINKGITSVILSAGEYDMPNLPVVNGLKLMGESRENTKINLYNTSTGGDFCLANSTATLENMTIITEIKDWAGFQNATNLTFNKCDFVNNLFLSGNATFNECHFTVTTNHYNVWAYSANSRNYTATFNTCLFDCAGKSIYIDGNAGGSTTMNFTGCTFNDNDGGATDKAAIETGTTYGAGATYNVNITGCTFDADGFAINPNGINTNSTIWANKNSMSADKLNIVIDGQEVY